MEYTKTPQRDAKLRQSSLWALCLLSSRLDSRNRYSCKRHTQKKRNYSFISLNPAYCASKKIPIHIHSNFPCRLLICMHHLHQHIAVLARPIATKRKTGAVSPMIPSAPKCSSRHFIFHRKPAYVLSNPLPSKPSIVFSPRKPFCSHANYSSWWLGICWCIKYFEQFS